MNASKISVSLTLVGTLLVSAVGAGMTYGATRSTINENVERTESLSRKVESLELETRQQREWRARVEAQMEYLVKAMDRLEQRLGTRGR
jgi:hypothetical protein